MSVYSYVFGFLFWFVLTILVHEAGHNWMAERLGYKTKWFFSFKKYEFGVGVLGFITPEDDRKILMSGIMAGFVCVFLYALFHPTILGLGFLAVYLAGIKTDIKELIRLTK